MQRHILLLLLFFFAASIQAQTFKVGDKAPEIVQNLLSGEEFKLSSIEGKVIFVDFWASWCRPCRKENPMLIEAYNKYKDKEFENATGFTIVSISLDKNKTVWENAIKKDNMLWPYHLSDLQGWNNAVGKQLNITKIPANFLIDGTGTIVAVNLRGKALSSKLKKLAKGSGWGSIFGKE